MVFNGRLTMVLRKDWMRQRGTQGDRLEDTLVVPVGSAELGPKVAVGVVKSSSRYIKKV